MRKKKGRVLAVANMKGGVGKTTTVVMLTEALAAAGNEVLVIDVDPQSSASFCVAGDELFSTMIQDGLSVDAYLEDAFGDRPATLATRARSNVSMTLFKGEQLPVSLISCGFDLRKREREIAIRLSRQGMGYEAAELHVYKRVLPDITALRKLYDYVIFDCAPGLALTTEVAIRAADVVLVTTIPDYLCKRGLEAFVQAMWREASHLPRPARDPYVVVTRLQQNIRQHLEVMEQIEGEARESDAGFKLLQTRIPTSAALADALLPDENGKTLAGRYGNLVTTLLVPIIKELEGLFDGH